METKVVHITPKMAAEMLTRNSKINRNLRPTWVADLAERMARGEWGLTHQGIAFDESNNLIDGQHRLAAVVKSGVSIDTLVTYNEETTKYTLFDLNPKRTMSEVTHLTKPITQIYSSMLTLVHSRHMNIQPGDVLKLNDSKIGTVAIRLLTFCPSISKIWSSSSMRTAAVVSVLEGEDEDYVFSMYQSLVTLHLRGTPPVAEAGLRFAKNNFLEKRSSELVFALGMYVFDNQKTNCSVIRINPEYTKNVLNILRQHVNGYLRNN